MLSDGADRKAVARRRIIHKRLRGQITVFLSLMITAVLLFLLACSEGVHRYCGRARASSAFISAAESVMGDYEKFMWERYHILAVDEGYGSPQDVLPASMEKYMLDSIASSTNLNKESSLYSFSVENMNISDRQYLADDGYEALINEIREYMKYSWSEEKCCELFDRVRPGRSREDIENARNRVEESDRAAREAKAGEQGQKTQDDPTGESRDSDPEVGQKQTARDGTGENENEKTEDPRDVIKRITGGGITRFVTGKNWSSISYGIDSKSPGYGDEAQEDSGKDYEGTGLELEKGSDVTDMLDEQGESDVLDKAVSAGMTLAYVHEHFTTALDEPKDGEAGMQCQQEYLAAGKGSDSDNIRSVVNRLTAMRFALDFAYASTSPVKLQEALSAATAVAGATANPAIIELVKYLMLAAVSYGEAILDVRDLYRGGSVALWKNESTWKCSVKNLGTLLETETDSTVSDDQGGLDYRQYLDMLMLMTADKDLKYRRMLSFMDAMGRRQDMNFDMGRMICGFTAETSVGCRPMFPGIPGIMNHPYTFRKVTVY